MMYVSLKEPKIQMTIPSTRAKIRIQALYYYGEACEEKIKAEKALNPVEKARRRAKEESYKAMAEFLWSIYDDLEHI